MMMLAGLLPISLRDGFAYAAGVASVLAIGVIATPIRDQVRDWMTEREVRQVCVAENVLAAERAARQTAEWLLGLERRKSIEAADLLARDRAALDQFRSRLAEAETATETLNDELAELRASRAERLPTVGELGLADRLRD